RKGLRPVSCRLRNDRQAHRQRPVEVQRRGSAPGPARNEHRASVGLAGRAGAERRAPRARRRVDGLDAERAARAWIESWSHAWPAEDADAIAGLYTDDAVYLSQPFRHPHLGTEGV